MIVPAELEGTVVLLVDDSEATRYVLGRWLRRAGFSVLEAANGADALAHLAATVPDIAVLDVNLPDMSGLDLLPRIKARDPSVPVLHVSATAVQVSDRTEGLQRGADAYLVEPVEREELLGTVVALLRYSTARRAAERLTAQMTSLHDGLMDMHAALTVEELSAAAARAAARILGRRLAIVAYAERDGAITLADPSGTLGRAVYRPGQLAAALAPDLVAAAGVVTSFATEDFRAPDELRALLGPLDGRPAEAMITRHHRGAGVAGLLAEGHLGDGPDRLLASQIVRSVAVAADNLRLFEVERGMALTLQRALLPDRSPRVAGVEIATRYVASDVHSEVGGDFYDAFPLADDRVALVIGDVQGHSLEAASVMGDLRAALRAYSIEGLEPAAVVERTNRLFRRFSPEQIATVCLAVAEPTSGRLTVVNAGHLPLLVANERGAWWLVGGCTLLGVEGRPPQATSFRLPADASIAFVTDGLVERRRRSLDDGLASMVEALDGPWVGDVEAASQALLDHCRPAPGDDLDDIAIMVARFAAPGPTSPTAAAPTAPGPTAPVVVSGGQMSVLPARGSSSPS